MFCDMDWFPIIGLTHCDAVKTAERSGLSIATPVLRRDQEVLLNM